MNAVMMQALEQAILALPEEVQGLAVYFLVMLIRNIEPSITDLFTQVSMLGG